MGGPPSISHRWRPKRPCGGVHPDRTWTHARVHACTARDYQLTIQPSSWPKAARRHAHIAMCCAPHAHAYLAVRTCATCIQHVSTWWCGRGVWGAAGTETDESGQGHHQAHPAGQPPAHGTQRHLLRPSQEVRGTLPPPPLLPLPPLLLLLLLLLLCSPVRCQRCESKPASAAPAPLASHLHADRPPWLPPLRPLSAPRLDLHGRILELYEIQFLANRLKGTCMPSYAPCKRA